MAEDGKMPGGSDTAASHDTTPRVTCTTCPHACRLAEGQRGRCRARKNMGGTVRSSNYGELTAIALDPIEKKPIARWNPGTTVLSVGSWGCNLSCRFCQNHSIAWVGAGDVRTVHVEPAELVAKALTLRDESCIGIAYTYNEPLIGWEYVRDTALLAHEAGLANVLVSNGMATGAVLDELDGLIDAANIDLKGPDQAFYDKVGGDFETVRRTIATLAGQGCHVEVTTLIIPGMNDDPAGIDSMARWLASVDPDITYHLTRFFGRHLMAHVPATPLQTLAQAKRVASAHLRHVLLGNV